jgi:UDP-GlcNAc:undecaprenyl-phosphate/decaprenyl-phosphate GlcNAc-1-phosphate transferase
VDGGLMRTAAAAVVAALVTAVCLVVLVPLLRRRGVIDVPGARSSHDVPVPRGGGISFALGMVAGTAVAGPAGWPAVAFAAVAAGVVGLVDDLRTLGAAVRLAAQVVVAVFLAWWVLGAARPWDGPEGVGAILVAVAVVAWVTGFVNAFNFMDGINGITAAQLVVVGAVWALAGALGDVPGIPAVGLVTAAAGAAFMPWNAPVARVFPGDVGSYFAGVWLAGWAVVAVASGLPVVTVVAPVLITLVDTSVTLVSRMAAGEPWHLPHRRHVYQRAAAAGWPHARVSLVVAGFMALSGAAGLAALAGAGWGIAGAATALAVAGVYLTLPSRVRVTLGRS